MKKILIVELFILSILILFISCNPDGIGIYYQVSEEVDLNTSHISDSQIFQIIETGGDVFVLAGSSVWKETADNWTSVSGDYYVDDLFEYSGNIYAVVNNDSLTNSKILSYDGTNWTTVREYNRYLISVFPSSAGTEYVLNSKDSGVFDVDTVIDPTSLATLTGNEAGISEYIIDGVSSSGNYDLLISSNNLYGTNFGALSATAVQDLTIITSDITINGPLRSITNDPLDNIYLTTSSGQIFKSSDNGTTWSFIDDIDDEPVSGSLTVITLNSDNYLIIGTENSYYEMNITNGTSIQEPSETVSTSEFSATYPDLATETIFDVYQSSAGAVDDNSGNYFYLATSTGLWKRLSDGTFQRR